MNNAKLTVLKNGLRVVLVPCEAESAAVGVFVSSGSRHETAKTAGISHFIEHMLFKGTPTRKPIDITRAIEGRGGNFNAMTGEEATCYYAHLPDDYLGEAVDILSDMYLRATIPEDEFAREKQVVIEEIKMYADEPDAVAMENLQRNIFPKSMLGSPVAGSEKSLGLMTPGDLKGYIKSHYRADNTVVVIAGSFDAQKALALGYRTFGIRDRRKYAATVLDAILGRGMSSRLFQEVREKRGLSYDIASRMQFFRDAGMFTVTAGLDASKAKLALSTIERELKKVCEKKIPAAELARAKEFLVGNFRLSHERVTSKLFFYGQTMLSFGRLMSPDEQVAGIKAVTAADVQAVAKAVFRPCNRSISWVVPGGRETSK